MQSYNKTDNEYENQNQKAFCALNIEDNAVRKTSATSQYIDTYHQQYKQTFERQNSHSNSLQTIERSLQVDHPTKFRSSSFRIDRNDYLQIYQQLEGPIINKQQQQLSTKSSIKRRQSDNNNMLIALENRNTSNLDIELDEIDPIETFYQDNAFFCLSKKSLIRNLAIRLTLWPYLFRNCYYFCLTGNTVRILLNVFYFFVFSFKYRGITV